MPCYGCCFRGGYAIDGAHAAHPHIVIATLRWAAEYLRNVLESEMDAFEIETIAREIEAGLLPT
jgi:hypothetical protein